MITIVIPTYRSAENIPVLIERICGVLSQRNTSYEIIVVNDNSPDNTLDRLKKIAAYLPQLKVISFARNFGQQIATSAGLKYASGDAVIIMDDDLQDPPEFLPTLLTKWEEGYDIVYAIRTKRKENIIKRCGYKLYYKLLAALSDIDIPCDSGDFCLMSRKVVDIIKTMRERDRFIRGLRAWVGFRQIGIECERCRRFSGKPAYNFHKIVKLSLDGILALSNKPLRITTWLGFIFSMFSLLGIIITVMQKIATYLFPDNALAVWPGFSSILLSILLIGGVQLICLGIIGEYIGRIFNEVKDRPLFIVSETIGIQVSEKLG